MTPIMDRRDELFVHSWRRQLVALAMSGISVLIVMMNAGIIVILGLPSPLAATATAWCAVDNGPSRLSECDVGVSLWVPFAS